MAADGSVVIDILADDSDFEKKTSSLGEKAGSAIKGVAKAAAAATVAAGAAVVGIATAAINAYANYEQLVGGVETLFGDSASVVQAYADNAYKTAGLSANAYMETVTSFSASLLQGLGGDTAEATKVADMAITDMADNANKMGTSMEAVQNAYQGFAKQNYTMLDNLKLGYGGTKTEMERLLADATALSGIEYDISNLNEVYEAIHVIQSELGITGTTALEASTTIQGSISSMKAAWQNMLVGLADDTQDFDTLLTNLIDSVGTVAENLIPRIKIALNGIADLAAALLPKITALIPELAADLLPELVGIAVSAVQTLAEGLAANAPLLAASAVEIMTTLTEGILVMLPLIITTAVQLLVALAEGIATALPTLIPAAVSAITTLVQGLIDNIPALVNAALQLIRGLAQGVIAAIPTLLGAVPTIITSLVNALLESIPLIIQAGIDLLVSLVGALPDIITTIVETIPLIIDGIITALLDNLPLIIQAGIDLLVALIQALPQIIVTIVQAIPQIISGIIDALIGNIDKIIMAGVQLFIALIENLPTIIIEIIKAVPQIIEGIVNAFGSLIGKIIEIGGNLLKGIWEGISNAAAWLWDKIKGFFTGLIDKVKGFLGIHSPSTVFAEIGGYTIEGFADGVDDGASANESRVMSTVAGLSSDMADSLGSGGENSGQALMDNLAKSATSGLQAVSDVAGQSVSTFASAVQDQLADITAAALEVINAFCSTVQSQRGDFYNVGVAAMSGLNEGLYIQGQQAIATARSVANSIVAEMQRALNIHSPSRKIRDLVGKPAAQGFFVGFEDEMEKFHRLAQDTIDRETGKISANAAAEADGKAAAQGITKEVHTKTNTVEKVATVEGDGVTGELVRMLGLKIKAEDRRKGPCLDE